MRCVVEKYINAGSTVNLCALDISKAFDNVNRFCLYTKLMDRGIPVSLLSVLEHWYNNCCSCVKWFSVFSGFFLDGNVVSVKVVFYHHICFQLFLKT